MLKKGISWAKIFCEIAIFAFLTACTQSNTPAPSSPSSPSGITPTQTSRITSPSVTVVPSATLSPTTAPSSTSTLASARPTNTPVISGTPDTVIGIVADVLRVRSGPGTVFAVLGRVQAGAQLTLLARSSDSKWFQLEYPAGSSQRGWVSADFLQVQGATDQLAVPPVPPAPLPTPTTLPTATIVIGEPCSPIPGQGYGTLAIYSGATERPAESHPDLNLNLRGYAATSSSKALADFEGGADPGAPQLRWLFGNMRLPTITRAYRIYSWDWNANMRGPLMDDPEVTMLGLATTIGEPISTPRAGGDLGEGYAALVLYASQNRITLKYTRDDHVVDGYTLHVENVCVEPSLLKLYQQMNSSKRRTLPALRAGQPFGRATGAEIGIVVRDKGSFMDPRSRKDWWAGQ